MPTDDVPQTGTDRRTVLRGLGAAGSNVVATGLAQGSRKPTRDLAGVSYDSLTHVPQAEATGHLKRHDDALTGRLHVGGFTIDVGTDGPLDPDGDRAGNPIYTLRRTGAQYRRDDLPLDVQFVDFGHTVTGHLTRPTPQYARLSFTLGDADRGANRDVLERGLVNGGDGVQPKGLDHVPPVPAVGVPQNTALPNLVGGDR